MPLTAVAVRLHVAWFVLVQAKPTCGPSRSILTVVGLTDVPTLPALSVICQVRPWMPLVLRVAPLPGTNAVPSTLYVRFATPLVASLPTRVKGTLLVYQP